MPKDRYESYVEHPRFGREPRLTGLNIESSHVDSSNTDVFVHWHPGRIPNTAVPADVSKQVGATIQVTHYYDLDRTCRKCNRPFIFFAEEQKYWYEELKLPLEADAVNCVPCRRKIRELQALKARYQELYHADRSETATYEMVEAALVLVEEGIFQVTVLEKLKGMVRQVAEPKGDTARFETIIDQLEALKRYRDEQTG